MISQPMAGLRSAALAYWAPAGPLYESDEQAGLSHLLEHMYFKGTPRRSARDIAIELESVGGELDGFTEREFTCYHVSVLGEHVERAVDVVSDMLLSARLSAEDLEVERNVVLEEIAHYEDSPDERVHDAALGTLWAGHPLGRPIHGSGDVIAAVTREQLVEFAKGHYGPGRTVIVAAGNVEHERLVELVGRHFAGEPAAAPPRPAAPECRRGRSVVEDDTEQVYICLASPGATQLGEDRYAEMVLACAVGGGTSSRLFQSVREERGLAYDVGCYVAALGQAGAIVVHAATRDRELPAVMRLLREELGSVAREGLREEELERTKEQLIAGLYLSMDSAPSQAARLARSYLYHGRVRSLEETVESIRAVSREDAVESGRARFGEGAWVEAIIGRVDERSLTAAGE